MPSRAVQYARYGGPEVLEVVSREDPQPGPGQVRVSVRAASVNPIDWKLRSGAFARPDARGAPDAPVVVGGDVAGVVDALGAGVDGVAVGDEVFGHAAGGSYADTALADASALVAKPSGLAWEVAGALGVVTETAYRVLDRLGLGAPSPGTVLLLTGASGGVGTIAVQLAVARGLTVIGVASRARQNDVRALGAVPVVHGDGLAARVRAVTDRVDAVFDAAGHGSLAELVELAGGAERVITIAHPDAAEHGVAFSSGGADRVMPVAEALSEAAERIASGRWRAPAVTTYPLEQAARAQEDNRTGAVSGKLVLVP